MNDQKPFYRKNFLLILAFLVLISVSLVAALSIDYSLTTRHVENEFSSRKIEVMEESVRPYNDFFQNKVPEISYYQGFQDSASVVKYVDTLFRKYAFLNKVIFYDSQISNHAIADGYQVYHISFAPKAVYQFKKNLPPDSVVLFKNTRPNTLSLKTADEFNKIAVKFLGFVESYDTTKTITPDELFSIFYSITPNRITYMSNPRREELKIFKDLMLKRSPRSPLYEQDVFTFFVDPFKLKIHNSHPELYQKISIRPLVYESLDTDPDLITTDIPLPGAFADYKLYFSTSKVFLSEEINRRFWPIALALLLIYAVLVFIAYLIFRNLNINSRMFKLQYDFINNLTHEFKTPVSVIKIAGNNIRSSKQLSDRERLHYGKILDEEADKLNDLMNKLLSFTQIENKAIKVKEEMINIEVFTQNIIDTFQLKYPSFLVDYEIDEVEYFKTDPVLLGSVFHNLIDNAYKYSPPDRKELNIRIARDRKNIVFTFTDRGIGIPKNELTNIFRKFYRIQSQYNQQGSVGLGLAFCKELANFMGGDIVVESKEGTGSVFTLSLPFEE
ncbi:sensor histidine kinase [Hufsiella ginkgonis]|uniref:histidine kinase n=1 Tax=Hufsiella ginkgonis TaxID=2695274 RepID=A0A7K1Y2Z3_9SPHI|nr:HAMP domain-containing sensor histidine kinase [Hufsiella ginkgonis]MXV17611.1 sensor histidine kinase [Hufsiella ginkgonis]